MDKLIKKVQSDLKMGKEPKAKKDLSILLKADKKMDKKMDMLEKEHKMKKRK